MSLLQLSRKKKHRSKWAPTVKLVVVAMILFAGWKALGPVKQHYRSWKQQRALAQAKEFIEKNDPRNAQIALELALSTVPNSPDAWRLAADMLEQVGAPQAMRLRRQIVNMVPDSVEDRAALIMSTLKFKDMNAARDAISGLTVAQGSTLPALRAQLAYALMTDNAPVADAFFDRIKALAPGEKDTELSHAILALRSPDGERVQAAKAELAELAKDPKFRLRVGRELMNEALLRQNLPEATKRAAEVAADADAVLADRLNYANIQLLVEKKPFADVFAQLAPTIAEDELSAMQFVQWLLTHAKVAEADRWIAARPAELQKKNGVLAAQADVTAALKDWDRLAALVEQGAWGQVKPETVRLAMSARLVDPALRGQIWEESIRSANASLGVLRILQRLSSLWGWEPESERTLWATLRMYPDQTWIHQLLFSAYRGRKDAAQMRNVMGLLREADPTVPRYQHDWALLSVLTEPTQTWTQPKETLKQLATEHPENANFAMSYAFALAQSGRAAEALPIVEKMSALERSLPARAPYLAFVYGANRQPDLVEKYGAAEQGDWLTEEKQLVVTARALAVAAGGPQSAARGGQ